MENGNTNMLMLRTQELIENPTPRIPVCLVLDTSGSMDGDPINELNEGIEQFFEAVRNDETAKYAAEIAIVTFGGSVQKIVDFAGIDGQTVPSLYASGNTPMNEAVELALDLLEQRKKEFGNFGVQYFQPWMVLMTDGEPDYEPTSAIQRTVNLVNNRKLTVFPIGIGASARLDKLQKFSPKMAALRLKGLCFRDFFEWLSASISTMSQSSPGDTIKLDTSKISTWGEI